MCLCLCACCSLQVCRVLLCLLTVGAASCSKSWHNRLTLSQPVVSASHLLFLLPLPLLVCLCVFWGGRGAHKRTHKPELLAVVVLSYHCMLQGLLSEHTLYYYDF